MSAITRTAPAALAAALLCLAAGPAAARGVALVLDKTGNVEALCAKGAEPVDIAAALDANCRIKLQPDERVSFVFYPTGETYRIQGPSSITIGTDIVIMTNSKNASVAKLNDAKAAAVQRYGSGRMVPAALVMRALPGVKADIRLDYPRNGELLLGTPRELVATVPPSVSKIAVALYEDSSKLFEQESANGRVAVPDKVRLEPGHRYRWEVSVPGANGPDLALASFRIAGPDEMGLLQPFNGGNGLPRDELVLYASLLENLGAKSAAAPIWQQLGIARPESGR